MERRVPIDATTVDIIHNDFGSSATTNVDATGCGKLVLIGLAIMCKDDECGRAIDWTERHDIISVFPGIWSGKCKFLLTGFVDGNLVKALRCVK